MFFGRDQFVWWIGVVEENVDPLVLGRVKVRIFGYHPKFSVSENLTDGTNKIPVKDLPWALVLIPGNSSDSYGRIRLGDWVVGFFMDGIDAQEPCVFGVLPTALVDGQISQNESFGKNFVKTRTFTHLTDTADELPNNDDLQKLIQRKTLHSESGHIINLSDHFEENSITILHADKKTYVTLTDETVILGYQGGTAKLTLTKDDIVVQGAAGTFNLVNQLNWISNVSHTTSDEATFTIGTSPAPAQPQPTSIRRPFGAFKVICTKLHELGVLSEEIYEADQKFGYLLSKQRPDVYNGYVSWAETVVEWMNGEGPNFMFWIKDQETRKEKQKQLSTKWASEIAVPWALHMSYLMGKTSKDNLAGKILMTIGAPMCKLIGMKHRLFGKPKRPMGLLKIYILLTLFFVLRLVVKLFSK